MYYFDNAVTTEISNEMLDNMIYCLKTVMVIHQVYTIGRKVRCSVEQSREIIASSINAKRGEIFFTSDRTESNNWAVNSIAHLQKLTKNKNHIIVSNIEHPSILKSVDQLKKVGFRVDYLPVDSQGIVDLQCLDKIINSCTGLVSVMAVNNEVGAIQPIAKIAD